MNLCFDDILLEPRFSDIKSRDEVSLESCGYLIPIANAPMDTVASSSLISELDAMGGMTFGHRYQAEKDRFDQGIVGGVWTPVGVKDHKLISMFFDYDCKPRFLIDVAHGDHKLVYDLINEIRSVFGSDCEIAAGNICTAESAKRMVDHGVDWVRVGIGGGSACTTRGVTGHGKPLLQSIIDVYSITRESNVKIIADGGIRNSGDIVKSLAFGADVCMLGKVLAGTIESPGPISGGMKRYRGMASTDARPDSVYVEGVSGFVHVDGTVRQVVGRLANGVRSGLSYSNARSISELREKSKHLLVSAMSIKETRTRL